MKKKPKQFVLNQGEDTEDWTDNDVAAEEEGVVIIFHTGTKQYCVGTKQRPNSYFSHHFSSGGQ